MIELLDTFVSETISSVKRVFEAEKRMVPTIFALTLDEEGPHVELFEDLVVFMHNKVTREFINDILKDYLETVKPIAVAFVSEAMGAKVDASKFPDGKMPTKEDILETQNVVYIHFETKTDHYAFAYEIGKPTEELKVAFDTGWMPHEEGKPGSIHNIMALADYEVPVLKTKVLSAEEALMMAAVKSQLGKSNDVN